MTTATNGTVTVTSWGRCDGDPHCRLWRVRSSSTRFHAYAYMHETDDIDGTGALEHATRILALYPDVFEWIYDDDVAP